MSNNLLLFDLAPLPFRTPPAASASLADKYKPTRIEDFIGHEKVKRILQRFVEAPTGRAWLFEGRSGIGKTAMALALASALNAETHLLPASKCTRENVARVWALCQTRPRSGRQRHLILVDEADHLTLRQQSDLRSELDAESLSCDIIWIFTTTNSEKLNDGFSSRCMKLKFSAQGLSKAAIALLERIWEAEVTVPNALRPSFTCIVKESKGDIRAALNRLEARISTL